MDIAPEDSRRQPLKQTSEESLVRDRPVSQRSVDIFGRDPAAPEYVGLTREEAVSRAKVTGVEVVRVFDTDPFGYRLDWRPTRLNLLCLDGVVVLAGWF